MELNSSNEINLENLDGLDGLGCFLVTEGIHKTGKDSPIELLSTGKKCRKIEINRDGDDVKRTKEKVDSVIEL